MSNFYEQHKAVQPYLINDASDTMEKEHYQSKEDRSKLDGTLPPKGPIALAPLLVRYWVRSRRNSAPSHLLQWQRRRLTMPLLRSSARR